MKRLAAILVAGALWLATTWPAFASELLPLVGSYPPGSIVIVTHSHELYFALGGERTIRYPVRVDTVIMTLHGRAMVAV